MQISLSALKEEIIIKKKEWYDCGGCEYFKNIIYYESFDKFDEDNKDNIKEDYFCTFFVYNIKLCKEEYDKIPEWCEL